MANVKDVEVGRTYAVKSARQGAFSMVVEKVEDRAAHGKVTEGEVLDNGRVVASVGGDVVVHIPTVEMTEVKGPRPAKAKPAEGHGGA